MNFDEATDEVFIYTTSDEEYEAVVRECRRLNLPRGSWLADGTGGILIKQPTAAMRSRVLSLLANPKANEGMYLSAWERLLQVDELA
ncbi:MAG: hypothetical protein ACHREM_22535 [Polyangiales bacterium]